ncbi:hypothetical protein ATE84_2941 [Aquimarina sp. MAR_2010_214]|uniref:hypothetical protein n=1 Tax=Aquimarina sp. MAR_2010_214 TaxID=1250026 RepID=UPI000C70A082|nr:hypothetical protein [Aquimarina sp. MAR_2010_214]PKV50873.1 hypothetical protein ATE84_2941 [Aquimarina sp. MAR_2010_214]
MKTIKHPLETHHKACVNKAMLGWQKMSFIYDISGCDWHIETRKWEGAIRCTAIMGYAAIDIFIPSNRPLLRLHTTYQYCSKEAVIEVHEAGLKQFNQIVASGLIQVPQHIKAFVANQKYRADMIKYQKTNISPNTHL